MEKMSELLKAIKRFQDNRAFMDEILKKLQECSTTRGSHLPKDEDKMTILEDKVSWEFDSTEYLLGMQDEIAKILKELKQWCIDDDGHISQIPWIDENSLKDLNEKLSDFEKAQRDVSQHLDTLIAELQSAVAPHDDDESAGPSNHNDHGGDDQNATAASDDVDTAAGNHAGSKVPEVATSSSSSGNEARGK